MAKTEKKANERNRVNERLLAAAKADTASLLSQYSNTEQGYNEEKAEEMRDEYGANIIAGKKEDTVLKRLAAAFINPFNVVLLALAAVSLITEFILPSGSKDAATVIIVVSMVGISGMLRFVQEIRSGNAAEKLHAMITTTTCVQRLVEIEVEENEEDKEKEPEFESRKLEIQLDEVVVGDIIHLAAGDMIPADVRILTSKDLFVSESSLTGESNPVEKVGEAKKFSHTNPAELNNLAFMGSNVISGSATAIVIAVGSDTMFGSIAKSLAEKKVVTSFEKGVNKVSWVLIRFMAIMVPVVFAVNGITKGLIFGGGWDAWVDSLMFGLAVAVGLTPEMLPMIVTTNLAKGAVKMANKKTVVKNISSIQNFGAMDILCTDKTGTLTQDKIVLEKYLDIHGNPDLRILRHAFLNSYFQTGLKNLMDVAILDHEKEMDGMAKKYEKVDEIPFDFARRRMSVVIKDASGKTQLITKGAVEEMLSVCTYAEYKGEVLTLSKEIKNEIMHMVDRLNSEGMRVLGVAQKTNPPSEGVFSVKHEKEMVFIGYLAFLDPPKETSAAAIKALKEHGVTVKVLTGDNASVTEYICRRVGINVNKVLLGSDIEAMDDEKLSKEAEESTIFAKLNPQQKARLVQTLRANGHVVGFLGDGINDAPALREADVGISVDTAVDIAKESADIILLEKDLMVLERGVVEGRKTFANIIKYIKMTASSNFGNMLSMLVASALLPFLPMLPLQILVLNLIYDISCISIPWDRVDPEYILKPRKWDASSISKFMLRIGPTSSVFDITTYILMFFIVCPQAIGLSIGSVGLFNFRTALTEAQQIEFMAIFQSGWFVESLWSQTLVIHMIRTPKVPFIKSRASLPVFALTTIGITVGTIIPFTAFGGAIGMTALPWYYFPWLVGTIILYMALATLLKKKFVKRYGELL